MTLSLRQSTGTKQAANLKVRTGTGVHAIAKAFIRNTLGIHEFFGQFSVGVSPASGVYTRGNSGGTITLTTRPVSAIVDGAVGAVTYLWTQVDGDPVTIDTPTAADTTVSGAVGPGASLDAHIKCHVTDAGGHSADTASVSVGVGNEYGGGA